MAKPAPILIDTPRLRLRPWRNSDRDPFATMNVDPEVMLDLGGPPSRIDSDAKFDRYVEAFEKCGFGRWVIDGPDAEFLGYAGVMPSKSDHPLGQHFEIGWRLVRRAWGHGYASEAAGAALTDAFTRAGLPEVLAYTASDNLRSQAVMARLKLRREPERDFTARFDDVGVWTGLVWVARPDASVD